MGDLIDLHYNRSDRDFLEAVRFGDQRVRRRRQIEKLEFALGIGDRGERRVGGGAGQREFDACYDAPEASLTVPATLPTGEADIRTVVIRQSAITANTFSKLLFFMHNPPLAINLGSLRRGKAGRKTGPDLID